MRPGAVSCATCRRTTTAGASSSQSRPSGTCGARASRPSRAASASATSRYVCAARRASQRALQRALGEVVGDRRGRGAGAVPRGACVRRGRRGRGRGGGCAALRVDDRPVSPCSPPRRSVLAAVSRRACRRVAPRSVSTDRNLPPSALRVAVTPSSCADSRVVGRGMCDTDWFLRLSRRNLLPGWGGVGRR
jgi:hypothetical protein